MLGTRFHTILVTIVAHLQNQDERGTSVRGVDKHNLSQN